MLLFLCHFLLLLGSAAAAGDPYRTLGLRQGASFKEVKNAYRNLALLYHPDKAGPSSLERFIQIQVRPDTHVSKLQLWLCSLWEENGSVLVDHNLSVAGLWGDNERQLERQQKRKRLPRRQPEAFQKGAWQWQEKRAQGRLQKEQTSISCRSLHNKKQSHLVSGCELLHAIFLQDCDGFLCWIALILDTIWPNWVSNCKEKEKTTQAVKKHSPH